METWKDIKGYEGRYQISNRGAVKSMPFMKTSKLCGTFKTGEKIRKVSTNQKGYKSVDLYSGDASERRLVHRLVADAFIPNEKEASQVNHKDGDPSNNEVSNLEWVTASENALHSFGVLGRTPSRQRAVEQLKDGAVVTTYKSIMEASRDGFSQQNISSVCAGKRKTCGGFEWRYAVSADVIYLQPQQGVVHA